MSGASLFPEIPDASAPPKKKNASPCDGCPCEKQDKVLPEIPDRPELVTIGINPGPEEVKAHKPNVGQSGMILRSQLKLLGFNRVAHLNVLRCTAPSNEKDRDEAVRRCTRFLHADLRRIRTTVPLVLFGNDAVSALLADGGARKKGAAHGRGLWHRSITGAPAFVMLHAAQLLRLPFIQRSIALEKWKVDLARMAERVQGREKSVPMKIHTYQSPREAHKALAWLSKHAGPWAFDIESYDARESPSRKNVAVDPFHPDFRVRGIAFAWREHEGMWIELMSVEGEQQEMRALLEPVFDSDADKYAFNGDFDENALVVPGWVSRVRMRTGDPMLALVALGDGRHESLTLEKAMVDLLGWPQPWGGLADKSLMRTLPTEQVARGAVFDAAGCLALGFALNERLTKEEYL